MTDLRPRTRSITALGEYLWARRSLLQPETVGLTREANRRVPGLRREEVARLASISPEYYLRLEQGHDREPSDQVLRGLAKALVLDEGAEQYLLRLRRLPVPATAMTTVPAHLLDGWAGIPAFVMNDTFDLLLVNERAAGVGDRRFAPGLNLVEHVFSALDHAEPDWEASAEQFTAALRYHGDPYDHRYQQLVGRLSIRDADFGRLWARHDARPLVLGRLRTDAASARPVTFHTFEVPDCEGMLLTVLHEDSL